MKNFIFYVLLTAITAEPSQALQIPIRANWNKPNATASYTQWANHAPPAYVWQNDPETLAYYGESAPGTRATNFCVPSAIGTAMLNQKLYRKTAPLLKVAGVSTATQTIDTAVTLKSMVGRCQADVTTGTRIDNALQCISDLYRESGYANARIQLISNNLYGFNIPNYTFEKRQPRLEDIKNALDEGFEVIGIAVRIAKVDGAWKKVGSHWFNISGFGSKSDDSMDLFVTDPTVRYGRTNAPDSIDGNQALFHPIKATNLSGATAKLVPLEYAPIRLTGLKIEVLTKDVVLGSVLILKPE